VIGREGGRKKEEEKRKVGKEKRYREGRERVSERKTVRAMDM
jgi:hypothetical protein